MEQETLVNELKTRVGDTDLSERTVTEVAKSALPLFADDSKITDELWNATTQMLKSALGQERAERKDWITKQQETLANADRTAREQWQKEFEEKWAKEHTAQELPLNQDSPSINQGDDDKIAAAVAKAMEAQNKKLFGEDGKTGILGQMSDFIKQSQTQAKEAKVSAIRKELKDYLVTKGANLKQREPLINLTVKNVAIDDNFDIDKAKLEVEKAYEKNYKDFYGDGGKPFGGDSVGSGASSADADLKKYLEGKAAKAKAEADAADNLRKKFK